MDLISTLINHQFAEQLYITNKLVMRVVRS